MLALIKNATLQDAAVAFRHPLIRHILLAGPAGVGKTEFSFRIAKELGLPAWKWQLHPESTPSEGYGFYVPAKQGFDWQPGPVDLAYTQGGVLILDEIIEAAGPVKTALYGALDTGAGGTMTYVGRVMTPSPKYKVIATMNGIPHEGGMPDALLDRFDATFLIVKPGAEQLALLESDLQELCIDSYETARDPLVGPDITFRMLRSLQTLRAILPLEVAVMSACHGNDKLAGSLLEALALLDPPVAVTVPGKKSPATSTTVEDIPDLDDGHLEAAAYDDDDEEDDEEPDVDLDDDEDDFDGHWEDDDEVLGDDE